MKALVRRYFEDFINNNNAAAIQENMTVDFIFLGHACPCARKSEDAVT